MKDERAAFAKSLLAKRKAIHPQKPAAVRQNGQLRSAPTGEMAQPRNIHPETLAHASNLLGKLIEGLGNGR